MSDARRGLRKKGPSRTNLLVLWVVLGALVVLPLALLLGVSFNTGDPDDLIPRQAGLDHYQRLTTSTGWLVDTLMLAVGVTALSTILGVLLAWILARTTIRHKNILTLLVLLPYPMGPMVAALAWSILGSKESGILNFIINGLTGSSWSPVDAYTLTGVVIVQSLFQVPVTFLLVDAALRSMDARLEEASEILGAGKFRTAMTVTLPLMAPAIVSAALFAFVSALGAFAIPTVLGSGTDLQVVTTQVYLLVSGFPKDYSLAAAFGVVLVLVAAVAVIAGRWVLKRRSHAVIGGKATPQRPIDPRGWRIPLNAIVYGYIFFATVLPIGALVLGSVQQNRFLDLQKLTWTIKNYTYILFDYPATQQSVVNSITLGIGTAVLGVILAAATALVVERARKARRPGAGLEIVAMAPQAVPRIVFSLPLLWLALLLPIPIYGSVFAILIAYIIVFLPLGYRSIAGVVGQTHPSLEEAGRILGASPGRVTASITVPLLKPGLIAAGGLLFMISLSEVGASILLSSTRSRVLGPMMFSFFDSGGIALMSALAIVQTVLVLLVLLVLRLVTGKRAGLS